MIASRRHEVRRPTPGAFRWWLGVGLALLAPAWAAAADIETRDFRVSVDGKHGGDAHMTIHRQDDGTVSMQCDTDIALSFFGGLKKYTYKYRGKEVWKDGRLQRLDSTCNDDGKLFAVTAVIEGAGLRVRVNNAERIARGDVWLTSYWCLPDKKLRDGVIALIDSDTGRDLEGRLTFVGAEQRGVAGQSVTLNHYRLVGKVNVDLWYDGSERLVRQEWLEEGHRTVLELTHIRR